MNSIGARVHLVYGTETELRHWLVLGGLEKPTAPSKPVVFISSSAADAQIVSDLRKALQTDFDFFDASNVPSGEAWSSSISEVLRSSDAVMAVFSDATSSWTSSEVEEATAFNLPVVPVMIGPNTKPPEGLHHISWNIIRVSEGRQWNPSELQTAGKKIASALHQQLGASRSKENTMPEQQRRPHILHGRGDAIRIVPLHDPARHMAEAAAAPAHLTYRNGPLLTNVEVFTVFWGTPW